LDGAIFVTTIAYASYVELNVVSTSAVAAPLADTVDKYIHEPPAAGDAHVGALAPAEVST
jgi:hypothetical protein